MAIEAFQLLGDLQQARHHGIAVARLLQPGLALDGLWQRDRIGRVVGDELAELVDLPVGHLQHAADVAQHGACLQLAVGDDLRDAIGAVLLLDVADDLVAAVLAEVDVEVRHRHALGIQEALEQQAEAQGIEVGDGERPGDDRPGARAAPRSHRDAVGFRPLDEVGDDQEVAGVFHLRDDVDLEGEALLIILAREARRGADCRPALLQAGFGLGAQLGGLQLEHLGFAGVGAGPDVARQDRLAPLRAKRAALGDLDGVGERLGKIGEQLGHLVGGLEVVLARHAAPVVLGEVFAVGDAQQRIVGLVVVRGGEVDLVGCDDGQRLRVGEIEELRLGCDLVLQAVALHLDVEAVAEDRVESVFKRASASSRWPCRRAVSIGPSGPPVNARRPSARDCRRSTCRCGTSSSPGSKNAREASFIRFW